MKNKQDRVFAIIESGCCSLDCLKRLPFNDIEKVKDDFISIPSIVDERNYILKYLRENTSTSNVNTEASK